MHSTTSLEQRDGIPLTTLDSKGSTDSRKRHTKTSDDGSVHFGPKQGPKDLSYNYHHRRLQFMVYNFLERPRRKVAIAYHTFVFLLIVGSLLLSILSTVKEYEDHNGIIWTSYGLEIGLAAIFGAEYMLRLWSCSAHGTYRGFWGKLKFLRKPYMVIDIIVIAATTAVIILDRGKGFVNISIFRFLRFLQVLRILRLDRQRGAFKIVSQVIYDHRQELLTCWYMSFIILITCSFLVYLAERASPTAGEESTQMQDLADGLYWGIISLLTIGYGDVSPHTWTGKFITCVFSLIGTAFFALPAGIIGSGFALQVAQHQRQKHFNKKRSPAASVIQACWNLYASDPSSNYPATWLSCRMTKMKKRIFSSKEYLDNSYTYSPGTKYNRPTPSLHKRRLDSAFSQPPFKSATPDMRRSTVAAAIPLATHVRDRCVSVGNLIMDPTSVDESQATILSLPCTLISTDGVGSLKQNGKPNGDSLRELSAAEKWAIRFIRRVKFAVAIRKFKEARRPYDVKDVIEQYTAGQIETFGYIKKLQSRIEMGLGFKDKPDSEIARHNIIGRLNSIETKVDMVETKMNLLISMIQASNIATAKIQEERSLAEAKAIEEKPPLPNPQRFRVTIHDPTKDDLDNAPPESGQGNSPRNQYEDD